VDVGNLCQELQTKCLISHEARERTGSALERVGTDGPLGLVGTDRPLGRAGPDGPLGRAEAYGLLGRAGADGSLGRAGIDGPLRSAGQGCCPGSPHRARSYSETAKAGLMQTVKRKVKTSVDSFPSVSRISQPKVNRNRKLC
jgi:hypothetical protein